jgi:hypothetical protein
MIRTIVTPQNNNLTVSIPNNYIGKEIEVLLYSKEELGEEVNEKKTKKTMADFRGILSENDYLSLKTHTEKSREEWNRDI